MLTPNRPIALLPQDRQIMQLTGMSEKDYRFFMRQTILHSKLRPGEPTAFLETIIINLIIGVALTYLASLLSPKPRQQSTGQLESKDVQGQTLVNGARYTPKTGFDSVQNVVELGSTVPLVYTNRQMIGGIAYGGVRVNTSLLFSQIYSIGGGQLLRAIFLVGEGKIENVDPTQFALGNNIISGYDLQRREAGRICLYYNPGRSKPDSGRLKSSDYIAGVEPGNDVGNAENDRGGDVFQVRGEGDTWTTNFCFTSKPNNQTTFGLYGFIGNNMSFRVNPVFRPAVIAQTRDDGKLNCKGDGQQISARRKQDYVFAGRTGLTTLNGGAATGQRNLEVGDTVELNIYATTDSGRTFSSLNGETTCTDVGQSVSSRQRSSDEQINYGDLYRIGSAFGICVDRTPEPFVSSADNDPVGGGRDVTAKFEIIRRGICDFYSPTELQRTGGVTATQRAHVMSAAEANVSTERQGKIVEIGLRSQSQINISGLCSYKDGRGYQKIDDDACNNDVDQQAQNANLVNFISGNYSTYETRYSFFRVAYRVAGTDTEWSNIAPLFGIRSTTGVAVYNYLRLEFSETRRWDIRVTPISGWEIRSNIQPGQLIVLDPHMDNRLSVYSPPSVTSIGVTVQYTGEPVARSQDTFGIPSFDGSEVIGNGFVADESGPGYNYMVDAWARLAEGFIYNEVTATTSQPEHELVYLNCITKNESTPNYDDLAIVGMNIRSSKEISSLNQFSVYVNQGINSTSNFPEVLYDLLTNDRYGTGQVLNPLQIDKPSFDAATNWARDRRYFFDGAVSEKVNIRGWGAETASNFLLDLIVRNGKFALSPVANFDSPEKITALFSAGNILEDSFSLSYTDDQDRIPPRISVLWREERETSTTDGKGLFPVVREVTVRENGTPESAPLEKIDISEYATSERHAIDRAKWECLTRRLVTHTVSFKTTPTEAALDIGAVFKVGMETVNYNQPQNGAIAANGEVTAWPPIADGTYSVLLWDGSTQAIQETSITISGGKSSPRGSVFCLRSAISSEQTYKTQSLSFDEEGNIDVVASYFPTDSADNSLMVQGFDDANFTIEGRLGAYRNA